MGRKNSRSKQVIVPSESDSPRFDLGAVWGDDGGRVLRMEEGALIDEVLLTYCIQVDEVC